MREFIESLDEFVSVYYDNYSVISRLNGYVGSKAEYLKDVYVPLDVKHNFKPESSAYKICFQKNKKVLISELKRIKKNETAVFSVISVPLKLRLLSLFNKQLRFGLLLSFTIKKYGFAAENFYREINQSENVWKNILRSKYHPTKYLLYRIGLVLGIFSADMDELLARLNFSYSLDKVHDILVKYLISKRTFNPGFIKAAFEEYGLKFM